MLAVATVHAVSYLPAVPAARGRPTHALFFTGTARLVQQVGCIEERSVVDSSGLAVLNIEY